MRLFKAAMTAIVVTASGAALAQATFPARPITFYANAPGGAPEASVLPGMYVEAELE